MDPYKFNEMMKKLRNGEEILCPVCGKGHLKSIGDCTTTHCFECSECKKKLNIN